MWAVKFLRAFFSCTMVLEGKDGRLEFRKGMLRAYEADKFLWKVLATRDGDVVVVDADGERYVFGPKRGTVYIYGEEMVRTR